ncbi:putative RNA polymerase II transcription factor SIII subunit A like protein [Zymoseptoria brevis]|uniref:Putative RNA polymerase II transcription factor SIII subunit A like protein n=1 Tax=Zymoseptoria brevis TaxID=1047168 RepID=A0A0F4GHN8_9PEZI|nr:putative RNA polymerase II transcription factor SIII subunit A like protein [Zymoseptoria brevis]
MAIRTLQRNVDAITDIADMPYEVAEGFLKSIHQPQQLRALEVKCPQIADADADLWKKFIARDIADYKKKWIEPKNPRSWWKVYRKLTKDQELLQSAQEDALRKSLVSASVSKTEHSATFVPSVVPFAGTVTDARVCADARARARTANNGGRPWQASASKSGLSAIGNIRRQTAEAARNRAVATRQPMRGPDSASKLAAGKQQIRHVPTTMMEANHRIQPRKLLPHEQAIMADHQRYSKDVVIRAPARAGARNGTASTAAMAIAAAEQKKREGNEAKLRALTTSAAPKAKEAQLQREVKCSPSRMAPPPAAAISPNQKATSPPVATLSQQAGVLKRKRPANDSIFAPKKVKK